MQALHEVVQKGKVRYIGMNSCWAWQFQRMQSELPPLFASIGPLAEIGAICPDCSAYAIEKNLTPFISMQNHYSALYREEEREMMPMLKHYGVGTVPWGPLAAGCESPLTSCKSSWSKHAFVSSLSLTVIPRCDQCCVAQSNTAARLHEVPVSRNREEVPLRNPGSSTPLKKSRRQKAFPWRRLL